MTASRPRQSAVDRLASKSADDLARVLADLPMDKLATVLPWLVPDARADLRNRAIRRLFRRWFGLGAASLMARDVRSVRGHLASDDDSRHADLVRVSLLGGADLSRRQLRRIAPSDGPAWPDVRNDAEKSVPLPP